MRVGPWFLCLFALSMFLSSGSSASFGRKHASCMPGELVFVDCNLCTCNPQGYPNPVCARMWCQPPPKNKPIDSNEIAASK